MQLYALAHHPAIPAITAGSEIFGDHQPERALPSPPPSRQELVRLVDMGKRGFRNFHA